jgi:hypothetical protein
LAAGGCRLIEDAAASGGWTIQIDSKVDFAGISAEFIVGTDVQIEDELKVTLRYRAMTSGWSLSMLRDGAEQVLRSLPAMPDGYGRATASISLKNWRRGENLSILLRPGGGKGVLQLDFAEFAIVAPEIARVAPPRIASLNGAAAHADVERHVADLTRTVNMLLDMLKSRGDMAG